MFLYTMKKKAHHHLFILFESKFRVSIHILLTATHIFIPGSADERSLGFSICHPIFPN